MITIHFTLFGSMRMYDEEKTEEIQLTSAIQLLLAYLLLNRHRTCSRDVLVDLFWQELDEDKARNCLNTALWRLRKALKPYETASCAYLVSNTNGEIGFNPLSQYWLDVAEYTSHVRPILSTPVEEVDSGTIARLESTLDLYQGELLEGVYADWAISEREHLRILHHNCLAYLMEYHRLHLEFDKSLAYGQKILEDDPLREEIHRAVMRLHMACGQRSLAIRQYRTCQEALLQELGIAPMDETQALFLEIIGEGSTTPLLTADSEKLRSTQTLLALQQALHGIDQIRSQVVQAIKSLEDEKGSPSKKI
jgi:DNA-binding SARP family transcriptional activator